MECFGRHAHGCFPLSRAEIACLFLSRASIPEMCQKRDYFQAFVGALLKYPGEKGRDLAKKRSGERKKNYPRCHAILCEKADLLKASGSVASYLENGNFYGSYTLPVKLACLLLTYSRIGPSFYKHKKTLVEG